MAAGHEAVPGVQMPPDQARSRQRRGSGGRWLIWALRGVLWVVLLLIGFRGVAAIVSSPAPASPAPGRPAPAAAPGSFPVQLASAYALQFGQAYLNFDPATASQRATELAGFLPPGSDSQLGWNGSGVQQLQSEQVASVSVQGSGHAVVTLLATVNGHLLELGVPLYTAQGGIVVTGEPALLPAPARATPPQQPASSADQPTQAALTAQLPAFFRAYASGDAQTMARFLAPGAQVTGLHATVVFRSLSHVVVPAGHSVRHVSVTVTWLERGTAGAAASAGAPAAPATLQMSYAMTVVRRAGTWYVRSIGASAQLPGAP